MQSAQIPLTTQIVSFAGAVCILAGYVGHQLKYVDADGRFYNAVNALGGGLLLYAALRPFSFGFVLLESTWTVISIWALFRRPASPSPPDSPVSKKADS